MYNLLNNIQRPETPAKQREIEEPKMNLPGKKKLGIATLIVAGLIAVAVPLMFLHGTSPQGTSPNPTTTTGNNGNSGSKASSGSSGGTSGSNTGNNGGSGGSNGGTSDSGGGSGETSACNETKTHDPPADSDPATKSHDGNNGNAYGLIKNRLDTTVALVKSMGTHDSAYHLHHDTDTDNDTVHAHHNALHDPTDHDSSCASGEEDHEQD